MFFLTPGILVHYFEIGLLKWRTLIHILLFLENLDSAYNIFIHSVSLMSDEESPVKAAKEEESPAHSAEKIESKEELPNPSPPRKEEERLE